MMEGYKAFNAGWKCRDFQYEIGEMYELPEGQKLEMCKCGFHFCKNPIDVFGYYPMDDSVLIAKVEALGEVQQEGTKYVTDKIKIVREFTRKELQALILDGKYNTGENNSGDWNSGNCNSGNRNSGDWNSGNCNSGNWNSGNWNSGDWNSGDWNSGDWNSGDCNSGNWNSGMFNTNEPFMRAFNRETTLRYSDFLKSINYNFYAFCKRINEKALLPEDIDRIKALPNYDPDIFKEITGIDLCSADMRGEEG